MEAQTRVQYDYLDFSTVEQRRAMREAEVRINRRTAPALYRGVGAVDASARRIVGDRRVRHAGGLARRDGPLRSGRALRRLAARGALDLALMPPLATALRSSMRAPSADRIMAGRQEWHGSLTATPQGSSSRAPASLTLQRVPTTPELTRATRAA